MNTLIVWLIALPVVACFMLGVWWLLHKLWIFVMSALCLGCNPGIISPDYWVFVGAWILLGFVGRLLFRQRK